MELQYAQCCWAWHRRHQTQVAYSSDFDSNTLVRDSLCALQIHGQNSQRSLIFVAERLIGIFHAPTQC